jgi:hypothetical protein
VSRAISTGKLGGRHAEDRERQYRRSTPNGVTIDEAWREKIYSYGGIAPPGFPNLFMLYGPFAP